VVLTHLLTNTRINMTDLERAKKALVNAHNAGDVAAAKEIANYIKSQGAGETQKQSAGFAKSAPEAFGIGLASGLVPFGQRATSALAAGAIAPFVPETFGQLYEQAQADTKATQEANPGANLAGAITGAVATIPTAFSKAIIGAIPTQGVRGAINAIPQGLSGIDRFVRGSKVAKDAGIATKLGATALRSVKGAAVAAPVAGLYGAGEAEQGQELEGFTSGAKLGAAVGGALPVAGAAIGGVWAGTGRIYRGLKARDAEALEKVGQAIKDKSSAAYAVMRESGATFKPGATNLIIENMQKQLTDDGILNPRLHKKTVELFDDFKNEALDQNITLEGLDQWRQLFGQVAGEFTDKVNARKASILKSALDDAINELPESAFSTGGPEALTALRTARQEWARQSKFNAVADIIEGSSGDSYKLKRDLEKFRLNPKKTRGWSKDELDALKTAASQTTGEGILKIVGKFGFDLGSGRAVGNTALPALGGILSGVGAGSTGIGLAVPAVGTAARVGQKAIARAKADDLLKVIEGGGELTIDMISALPESEKNKLLSRVLQMTPKKSGLAANVETKPRKP
jgi:hypothetical protein